MTSTARTPAVGRAGGRPGRPLRLARCATILLALALLLPALNPPTASQALGQHRVATPTASAGGSPTPAAQATPPSGDGELVGLRTRDSKTFQLSGGRRKTLFGHHLHYQPQPGQWRDVDLNFRAIGPGQFQVDHSQAIITVTPSTLSVKDRDTGHGIVWTLPSPPIVSGKTVRYRQDGLEWTYTAQPTGVKLEATVSSKRGPHTYGFPYTLVGATQPLTIAADGSAFGDGFSIPAPIVKGANHRRYSRSWGLARPGVISVQLNDSPLPMAAFPYVIDPTVSIGNDPSSSAWIESVGPIYPPNSPVVHQDLTNAGVDIIRTNGARYGSPDYYIDNGFERWDTSSLAGQIPSSATVTDHTTVGSDDGRSLTADWYPRWPITASDYSIDAQTSALSGYPIGSMGGAPSVFPLDNVSGINTGGWTELRFHVSGGQPQGANLELWEKDQYGPFLVVTYNVVTVITSVSPNSGITAGSSALNTETIHGSGFTGATAVSYGGVHAPSFNVDSDTQITAFSPPHAAGTVDIQVITPSGTSAITSADQFTYYEPARSVVYVHGIADNYVDIENKRDWAPIISKLSSHYATFVFPYYQDKGYSSGGGCNPPLTLYPDHGTGPLYVDPNSEDRTICDNDGALAYSSSGLADYMKNTVTRWAPSAKIAVIGHSMGAAMVRGWLALAGSGTTTEGGASGFGNVDTAIFISGAQEGSFIAAAAGWIRYEENPFAAPFQAWIAHKASEQLGYDFHRPGVKDMTPSESWYQSVNHWYLPPGLHYYNFSMDIHAQNETTVFFHTFGTNDQFSVGDMVMLPGDDDPNRTNTLGGSRFLPSGFASDRHQFIVNNHHTVVFNGVIPNNPFSVFHDFANDPAAHWNLGNHTDDGQVTVDSCNGTGIATIAQKVVDLLANPAFGCT